ncbi:GDP-mannose 4,6-dehydratase [Marinospirillum alkaliphilum]|uniref:dTDP-glucose 4,6-dehydratase n=1 Tax=Marinospirillum alkaliphilum DSM 21637 TaxID=1122209 RepID=A0A1K1VJA9_9GAMM|nr:GDP-mannose 4,6-dehydratase [Marinospirillum alkaliphilum]SFX25222.1 dTDP-glucose 4,6-dehydratase [Marinospirillum alkaliphilum DSM 21637]
MKLMIAGGTGFIGSNMIHYQVDNTNNQVTNLDKLTETSNTRSLGRARNSLRYTFKQVDLLDQQRLLLELEKFQPDALLHLATTNNISNSIESPDNTIQNNCFGTLNLLEAVRAYHQELPAQRQQSFRLIYLHPTPSTHNTSPCCYSRQSAAELVLTWHNTYQLPALTLACPASFGPCQFPEHLIPNTLLTALDGKHISITEGEIEDQWIYVQDLIEGINQLLVSGQPGCSYQIHESHRISRLELTCQICDILDELQPQPSSYRNLITFAEPGIQELAGYYSLKTNEPLKKSQPLPNEWLPTTPLKTALETTISWYLNNPDWVTSITSGEYLKRRKTPTPKKPW